MKKHYHHGDLRRQLIKTALDIIAEQGLEKVSMRGLGQRIGVSRTAPYRHFKDKSALLCAIAEQGHKKLTRELNHANAQTSLDPVTRLMNVGVAYVEFALSNPVHYRMMFGNEILETKRTEEFTRVAEGPFNELICAVRTCQEKKRIKPLNPYIIANTLWAMAHGIASLLIDGQVQTTNAFKGLPALLQAKKESGSIDVRQIVESMGEILLFGLLE